jgi:acyl-CoA thioesterase-1
MRFTIRLPMVVVGLAFGVVIGLLPLSAAAADAKAIVILGDSLSAAYGMELSQAWPSLLQQRLEQNGHSYRVFNSSIAGDTTQGGLARLPRLLHQHRPRIVILELGGNDGLRGLPIDVTRRNLASMIEQSQGIGAMVVLAGIRIPPNYGLTYTEKFNGIFTSLEEQYAVLLIPFLMQGVALDDTLMMEDGIHPNIRAQPVLLDTVWAVLAPLLQDR